MSRIYQYTNTETPELFFSDSEHSKMEDWEEAPKWTHRSKENSVKDLSP
jgi:hypothetical protein